MSDLIVLSDAPVYDVTLVVGDNGMIVCRNCRFHGCAVYDEPRAAFLHALVHQRAGHRVRRGALDGLTIASAVLQGREAREPPCRGGELLL